MWKLRRRSLRRTPEDSTKGHSCCQLRREETSMKQIVSGLAVMVIIGCLTPLRSSAGDEVRDARIEKGKLWYDKYCTPCHGPGGAPGSAVFPATKKPVDLRTIAQRNGGNFP